MATVEEFASPTPLRATRVDRKYLLPERVLEQILSENRELWIPESEAGPSGGVGANSSEPQRYETLYFDTPDLGLFHAARLQRPSRAKVRVRTYLDTGESFVEVKQRSPRGETTKAREPWTGSLGDAKPFIEASLHRDTQTTETVARLVPIARTAYQRVAYRLNDGARMTVDRGLAVGSHLGPSHYLRAEGDEGTRLVIVETKSAGLSPTVIDRCLWNVHVRPQSLSKYALAIASFHPELPMGRWRRTVTQLRELG
jgi:hypothetical protein